MVLRTVRDEDTARNKPGIKHIARPLFGLEALRLQGLFESMLPNPAALHTFTNRDVHHLAGNAFSVAHVHLAMLVTLSVWKMPSSAAELKDLKDAARAHHRARLPDLGTPRRRWRSGIIGTPL